MRDRAGHRRTARVSPKQDIFHPDVRKGSYNTVTLRFRPIVTDSFYHSPDYKTRGLQASGMVSPRPRWMFRTPRLYGCLGLHQ